MTNEALREHVTSIGFNLTLSKRQIDALVVIHHLKGDWHSICEQYRWHTVISHWVTTTRCLRDRGLVIRPPTPAMGERYPDDFKPRYRITKAGTLVVNLLKEAGIYQDRLKELQLVDAGERVKAS